MDVSVQESGIIRPVVEKTEIRSSITERVDSVYVKEGQMLNQGDTILTFLQANPDFQIKYQQKRLTDMQEHLNDLAFLAKGLKPDMFRSASRRQEYVLFIQRKQEQETLTVDGGIIIIDDIYDAVCDFYNGFKQGLKDALK